MTLFYNILTSVLCLCLSSYLFYYVRIWNKSAIVEAGYRNNSRLNKPENRKLPVWNRVLFWDLCKNAKRGHKPVWIYFVCNLILCLGWAVSPVIFLICICLMDFRELIMWELGYTFGILFLITLLRIPLDLIYLPSEQKRYGIGDKKRKK